MFNRKQQRVQNCFASYLWGTHRPLFSQCQWYCQFWKLFNPSDLKIFTGLTDWQTDKTDCITPSHMRRQGNKNSQYIGAENHIISWKWSSLLLIKFAKGVWSRSLSFCQIYNDNSFMTDEGSRAETSQLFSATIKFAHLRQFFCTMIILKSLKFSGKLRIINSNHWVWTDDMSVWKVSSLYCVATVAFGIGIAKHQTCHPLGSSWRPWIICAGKWPWRLWTLLELVMQQKRWKGIVKTWVKFGGYHWWGSHWRSSRLTMFNLPSPLRWCLCHSLHDCVKTATQMCLSMTSCPIMFIFLVYVSLQLGTL